MFNKYIYKNYIYIYIKIIYIFLYIKIIYIFIYKNYIYIFIYINYIYINIYIFRGWHSKLECQHLSWDGFSNSPKIKILTSKLELLDSSKLVFRP